MTTLLTGCGGFIGRHVWARLPGTARGVDSLDKRVHKGKLPDHWDYSRMAKSQYRGLHPQWLEDVDTVIHLAAQVSVADSATDPLRYIQQNTMDTAEFLMHLPKSVKRMVVASSMSVYGEGGIRVNEDAPACPTSVYGLTKYDQERLCLIWGQQHNVPVVALRFFNVYGPGQALDNPYTGVLANFAKRLLSDKAPTVYEDGQQTRDFVYVEDVADAVVLAANSTVSGVFNVCTGDATTIETAARLLARGLGKDIEPQITGTSRVGDIRHCTGSPLRAKAQLDFVARVPFEEGIDRYAKALL